MLGSTDKLYLALTQRRQNKELFIASSSSRLLPIDHGTAALNCTYWVAHHKKKNERYLCHIVRRASFMM